MNSKTKTALVLAVVVLGTFWLPGVSGKSPQDVFDAVMMVWVNPDGNARFELSVTLTSEVYREKIRNGADFQRLVEELVYRNLLDNFHRRYANFTVYVSPTGPVEVVGNWTARVSFYIAPFFVEGKRGLECPYSGPLDFVAGGRVYSFKFSRIILILPKNWTLIYTFPDPDDRAENVLIWENADYLPMLGVRQAAPNESTNETSLCKPLKIELKYSPEEGKVFFNATYICESGFPHIPGAKNVTYFKSGNITEIVGYLIPKVEYHEWLFGKEWKAEVKLPAEFPEVVGGSNKGNGTVEIIVKKSAVSYSVVIPLIVGVSLIAVWRWRK